MQVKLFSEDFSPLAEMASYEAARPTSKADIGANAIFIGTMREFNEGSRVSAMTLEHYPGMTEKELSKILKEAESSWPIKDGLICHRIGDVLPGSALVLVAIWSTHRAEAFEACRFVMEELKSRAPFWKKERLPAGDRWVEKNTCGHTDAGSPSNTDAPD